MKRRGNWKGRRFKIQWLIVGLCIYAVILFPFFMWVDSKHQMLNESMQEFLHFEHYFGGEIWFSAIVTFTTAVPGAICGILALVQAKYIYKLETRYHRPSLSLHEASLEVFWTDKIDTLEEYVPQHLYTLVEKIKASGSTNHIFRIGLKFETRNEIEVKKMLLKKIKFCIDGKEYSTIDDIELKKGQKNVGGNRLVRKFKDGGVIYSLEKEYLPQIDGLTQDESRFWKLIKQFMRYKEVLNVNCRNVETIIVAEIDYEYLENQTEQVELRIYWDGKEDFRKEYGQGDDSYGSKLETSNGYFTYDGKK